ncbi:MAG: hypothetical protein BWY86_01164 [Candidatus Aminicenantes bacterium ADurb.Bin508]|nr:MAG: hypothetical protein BWY86_01164 [Candidatus Aminicenantes bacterium ADurb.Bin508]
MVVEGVPEDPHLKDPIWGGEGGTSLFDDQVFPGQAVSDDVLDADDLEVQPLGKLFQLGKTGHGPVGVEDLADHSDRRDAGDPTEVDGALGLPRTDQYPSLLGANGKDVPRAGEVVGFHRRIHGGPEGGETVEDRDSRRRSVFVVDGDGEGGSVAGGVELVRNHEGELQLRGPGVGEGQADETTSLLNHEVDGFGGDSLSGDEEIPFVLSMLVIDENEGLPCAYIFQYLFYFRDLHGCSLWLPLIIPGAKIFSNQVGLQVYPASDLEAVKVRLTEGQGDHLHREGCSL